MAKAKSAEKEERRKEKKASKEKHSETNGVHKVKKNKKEKKEKAAAAAESIERTTDVLKELDKEHPGSVAVEEDGATQLRVKGPPLLGALVPFANPLADEKVEKKVLKSIKKAAKNKALKRGVKELVKALRKSPKPISGELPSAIVVIAADISPMDVISHLPVLCEDHSIPYIFVRSRTELGAAGSTKRPTSVTMVGKEKGGKKKEPDKDEGEEEWDDVYKGLVRYVARASRDVRI